MKKLIIVGFICTQWGAFPGNFSAIAQSNPLADTIWEGTMTGKIKQLVRYVNGKKDWQATGAVLEQVPIEIWFPSESTFCVIYVNDPPYFKQNGREVAGKYMWWLGALPCEAADPVGDNFSEGKVDRLKKTLMGKLGSDERYPAWDGLVNARYDYKKNRKGETLNLTGVIQVAYQREAPEGRRYLIEPRPATIPVSGKFTKTSRKVSEEILKSGQYGFGERGMRGGL